MDRSRHVARSTRNPLSRAYDTRPAGIQPDASGSRGCLGGSGGELTPPQAGRRCRPPACACPGPSAKRSRTSPPGSLHGDRPRPWGEDEHHNTVPPQPGRHQAAALQVQPVVPRAGAGVGSGPRRLLRLNCSGSCQRPLGSSPSGGPSHPVSSTSSNTGVPSAVSPGGASPFTFASSGLSEFDRTCTKFEGRGKRCIRHRSDLGRGGVPLRYAWGRRDIRVSRGPDGGHRPQRSRLISFLSRLERRTTLVPRWWRNCVRNQQSQR